MTSPDRKPLPETDLSSAFAPPSRSAGLRMPPKRPTAKPAPIRAVPEDSPETTPSPETPAPEPAVETTPAAGDDDPTPKPRKASSARPASSTPTTTARRRRGRPPKSDSATRLDGGSGRLVLWTPRSIRARMQALRTAQGTLYLNQVLDALEANVDQLDDLVGQAVSPEPAVHGRLFERVGSTSAPTEGRVQLTISGALASQLSVIDDLVDQTGAPSRSALVNAALDAYLPPS